MGGGVLGAAENKPVKMNTPKQTKDFSKDFVVEKESRKDYEKETDVHKITQRLKQIEYGKNTLGYQRYTEEVPRHQRKAEHPRTPDAYRAYSKRAFDGQIKKWRRLLHQWDPPAAEDEEEAEPLPYTAAEGDLSSPVVEHSSVVPTVPMSAGKRRRADRDQGAAPCGSPDENDPAAKRPSRERPTHSDSWQHVSKEEDDMFGGWDEEEFVQV